MRFAPVFIASIFLSLHYGAILYVNSSLLCNFFKPGIVSLLFLLGAIGNVILFLFTPKLIEQFGKRPPLFFFLFIATLSTLGLAFAQSAFTTLISFVAYSSVLFIIYYYLDIFLEELSRNTNTGEVRGIYLTLTNLGIAGGPLILAILAEDGAFRLIYLVAALFLIPPILLALFSFRSRLPKWHGLHHNHLFLPFVLWWKTKEVRRVTLARLVLEFFFAFMVIYTPIYLHNELGFEWSELGIIFTIMLLPFVLLEWPAGELADRFYGEKEIMGVGFLITGISLLTMPFIGKIFLAWLVILFISRVGASLIEVTTESYFFKHVGAEDTGLISIFRLTRPVSIVLGATTGILALNLFSFEKIFFVLAVVVFFGFKESLSLKDTK